MPNICRKKPHVTGFRDRGRPSESPGERCRYLSESVEETRRRSLRLGVRDLNSKLKAQRKVAGHEEPETHATENDQTTFLGCELAGCVVVSVRIYRALFKEVPQ